MRCAILSDIHGNLEALEAVLADLAPRAPDVMLCLGDFVGYGASPNECIERLRPMIEASVAGNHDLAACGRLKLGYFNPEAAQAARWTESALTPENLTWLRELPYRARWRDALLVHSSPSEPEDWNYVLSIAEAQHELDAFPERLCFIGHSHYPGTFGQDGHGVQYTRQPEIELRPDHRYLVNVASVGQPRDGDPRAGYLLYDVDASRLTHVRLDYDIDGAMKRILDAGLPRFLADRLRWGE